MCSRSSLLGDPSCSVLMMHRRASMASAPDRLHTAKSQKVGPYRVQEACSGPPELLARLDMLSVLPCTLPRSSDLVSCDTPPAGLTFLPAGAPEPGGPCSRCAVSASMLHMKPGLHKSSMQEVSLRRCGPMRGDRLQTVSITSHHITSHHITAEADTLPLRPCYKGRSPKVFTGGTLGAGLRSQQAQGYGVTCCCLLLQTHAEAAGLSCGAPCCWGCQVAVELRGCCLCPI